MYSALNSNGYFWLYLYPAHLVGSHYSGHLAKEHTAQHSTQNSVHARARTHTQTTINNNNPYPTEGHNKLVKQ